MTAARPAALGLLLAAVIGVICAVTAGWSGVAGVATGAGLVLLAFTATVWLAEHTRRLHPEAVMAVALTSYAAKILVLGAVLLLLWNATWFDATSLAASVVGTTTGWLCGTVWEAMRRRTPIYDNSM